MGARRGGARLYLRMLGFMKPYVPILLVSMLLSVVIVSLDGVSLWLIGTLPKMLFDARVSMMEKPAFSLRNINEILKYWTQVVVRSHEAANPLAPLCLFIVCAFTLKNVFIYVNNLTVQFLNLHIVKDMRNSLYRHVLLLPVTYYDRNRSGGIVSLIVNDVQQINASMTGTLSRLFIEPLRLLVFVCLLFVINVRLTVIVFVVYPVLGYVVIKIGQGIRRRSGRSLESFSGLISVLTETINGVRAVKMFGMNEVEGRKLEAENRKFVRTSFRAGVLHFLASPLTEVLGAYTIASLLWYGGSEVIAGKSSFTAEDFFRYIVILFFSYQPLKLLASVNSAVQAGIAAAGRVFCLFDLPGERLLRSARVPAPVFEREIKVSNLRFTYPGCEDTVLRGLDFTVGKGQVVALVGSSGAGKTTILDLLPRFYELDDGVITIDGKDIREFDLAALRGLFGIVSQEVILFNDTVANNIAYGSENTTAQRVRDAARAANVLEFVENLPEGFETVIGERGVSLSGGQRQRVSIARALLRNPPILILDEATSSLDTESERLVQAAINNLVRNRTVIMVAHRLSTIRHADLILVIEHGRITEQGTHDELLALGRRYKHLHDMQFTT